MVKSAELIFVPGFISIFLLKPPMVQTCWIFSNLVSGSQSTWDQEEDAMCSNFCFLGEGLAEEDEAIVNTIRVVTNVLK